jgi:Cu(I)/Ag(I) efflux system periplasmic protein CusF
MTEMTMKYIRLALVLGVVALVAGCGQKQESAVSPQSNQATPESDAMSGEMGNMAMASEAGTSILAKGTGTVTAIDKTAGTITFDHGPIPEAKWPAMTMAFKAAPTVLESVQTGDKVAFDLKLVGSTGEVTAIQKR